MLNNGLIDAYTPLTVTGNATNSATGTLNLHLGSAPAFGSLNNSGTINVSDNLSVSGAYVQDAGTLSLADHLVMNTGSFSGAGGSVLLGDSTGWAINQTTDGTYYGAIGSLSGNASTASIFKYGAAALTLNGGAGSVMASLLEVANGTLNVASANALSSNMALYVNPQQNGAAPVLNLLTNQAITSLYTNVGGVTNLSADLTTSSYTQVDGRLNVLADGSGATTRTINTPYLLGAASGVVNLGSNATLNLNQSGNSLYQGILTGSGALTKTGNGTLLLSGASTFTGPLTINGGTVDTTPGATFADSLDVTVGAATTVNAALSLASLTNNAGGTTSINGALTSTGDVSNAGTLTFAQGTTGTIGGVLNNTGTLTSQGVLQVAGLFTNGASATANLGTTGGSSFGSLSNAGMLNVNSVLLVTGAAANSAGGTVNLNAGTLSELGSLNNAGTFTASSSLLVDHNVTNSGTLTLNAGNTYQFDSLTNSGAIAAKADLYVANAYTQNAGSLITSNNATLTTGSLSGAGGTITLNGTSTFNINQTANGTYSGVINGTGTVQKYGTGVLTLNGGVDSFAPSALSIHFGGVTVATADLLDHALNVQIDTPGTLTLQANQTIHNLTGSGVLNIGTNLLTLANGGSFSGAVQGTGNVAVSSGTFNLSGQSSSTSGTFSTNTGTTLNTTQTGSIVAPTVTLANSTVNLSGAITGTTVNVAGTLLHMGNGIDLGQSGATSGLVTSTNTYVINSGAITGNGSITGNTFVGGTTAGTIAPGNSPGVLTFGNLNFGNNSSAVMQIDGNAGAGATGGYDQIIVTGNLALSGSSVLNLTKSLPANNYAIALGSGIQIFKVAPGKTSGFFGSVVTSNFAQPVALNLSNGTVYGLGSYTPASFTAAVATSDNQKAILSTMLVNSTGGTPQYYGSNLLGALTSALAAGGANTASVFQRWSPQGYGAILDQMQLASLDGLAEVGGYQKLNPGHIRATGSIERSGMDGVKVAGDTWNKHRGMAYNIGFSGDLKFAQLNVTYSHTNGNYSNDYLTGSMPGDQFAAGFSAPLTRDQALRLFGRFAYGTYSAHGKRVMLTGVADYTANGASTTTYGGGLEYLKSHGALTLDLTAEYMGMTQKTKAFTESSVTASPLDLFTIGAMNRNQQLGRLRAKFDYGFSKVVGGYVDLGYTHAFGKGQTLVGATQVADPIAFSLKGSGLAADRIQASAGLRFTISQSVQINADGGVGNNGLFRFGGGARIVF